MAEVVCNAMALISCGRTTAAGLEGIHLPMLRRSMFAKSYQADNGVAHVKESFCRRGCLEAWWTSKDPASPVWLRTVFVTSNWRKSSSQRLVLSRDFNTLTPHSRTQAVQEVSEGCQATT